jgi:hypothetical protein
MNRYTINDIMVRGNTTHPQNVSDILQLLLNSAEVGYGELMLLDKKYREIIQRLELMDEERRDRRSILAPEVRDFNKMDDDKKLANCLHFSRKFSKEIDKLSRDQSLCFTDVKLVHGNIKSVKHELEHLMSQIKNMQPLSASLLP